MDIAYKDYPKIIKNAKLNGYGAEPKYTITAAQSGLTSDKADEIAAYLRKLGMTVVKKQEV